MVLAGCGKSDPGTGSDAMAGADADESGGADGAGACDAAALAADLRTALDGVTSDTDFTLLLRDSAGRTFSHGVGGSTASTLYESASTSKWVAAMTILRLVDNGVLALDDKPQDYLGFWTTDPTSPLSRITLAHLLSFTSGLEKSALCTNLPGRDFATCVQTIHDANLGAPVEPGTGFYYESSHLQVAGLMAVEAAQKASWSEVFADFKTATGLFPNGVFDLPSSTNPRLAGGMHWRGDEYLDFLAALHGGQLLSPTLEAQVLADHTASVAIKNSPALDLIAEDWHYGFGFWLECPSSTYNCSGISRVASPGAYGAYPFVDYDKKYMGVLARQGNLGTFPEGKQVFDAVKSEVEAWVACST